MERDDLERDERPSKTRRKQDMHALQALGAALVELGPGQLAAIDMPEALREAVLAAKRIASREARRRQLQYIGKLMREVDPAPIRAKLDEWRGQSREAAVALHRIERWRERLLADEHALTEFASELPGADLQRLRALVRNARDEQAGAGKESGKPPRAFRALFQEIKALMEGE
jgi:ribosome-associated protein